MSGPHVHGFAVVTGAAGGIGREVAFAFVEAGARGKFSSAPDYQAIATSLNVTEQISVQVMVDLAVSRFGRVDYFINAVGVGVANFLPFENTSDEDYDRGLATNAEGAFLLSKAAITQTRCQEPLLADLGPRRGIRDVGRGAIVNVCSTMALGAVPGKVAYVASKHAMLGITRAAGISRFSYLTQVVEKLAARGRQMEPDEVAHACLYLCSPCSVSITGTSLVMDCGLTLGPVL
ncbi:oxidoreductase [Xylariaceae sp. FL0255]|nr:oxidoreductase [Xylariaceae sp. FL0255]